MEYVKRNIKIFVFIVVVIAVITIFHSVINREVNYELEYDVNEFKVKEIYNKDDNKYLFKVSSDNHYYEIAVDHKYSKKRKLVKYIDTVDNNDSKCISLNVYNNNTNFICNNGESYYDLNITKENESNKINTVNNIDIYSDAYDYLTWNGKGLTYLNGNKELKFLTNESYTNDLVYQFKDYLIIADYDANRYFDKFYIYDNKKKEVKAWEIPFELSFDSYFLGYIDDDIYIFDVTGQSEYRINIKKRKIKVVSQNDMGVYYNGKKEQVPTSKFIYNMTLFNYNSLYNFVSDANKLFYKYYNSSKLVRISDLDIKDILYYDSENVYYISDNSVYMYNINKGESKLLESFEWNFNYHNQVFVFSR